MGIVRLLAAAVLVFCLASVATPAAAQPRPAGGPLELAVAVAAQHWGAVPCQGRVRVLPRQRVPAGLHADSGAWVTFRSSLGPNDLGAPAASYRDCTVSAGRSRWPTAASMRADWDVLCMTVVHEYGHLLGHEHDDLTPSSVMATVFTDLSGLPAACRATRPSARRR